MPATPKERIEKFYDLVQRFPDSEVPRFSLAQAYRDAGRYEDAEKAYSDVIAIKSDFMLAWIERARCLISLERYEDAEPIARQGLALAVAQGHQEPRIDCEALLEEIEEEIS